MGGRGSFDSLTQSIPVEKRKYKELDVIDGIKVIADFESKNGKTPVMSNTANTVYAVYSEAAGRIKHLFFYKNHVLDFAIDIEGNKSHGHKIFIDKATGSIGRKSHSKDNLYPLTDHQWKIVKKFMTWNNKRK